MAATHDFCVQLRVGGICRNGDAACITIIAISTVPQLNCRESVRRLSWYARLASTYDTDANPYNIKVR
jgi:hypothetical protein